MVVVIVVWWWGGAGMVVVVLVVVLWVSDPESVDVTVVMVVDLAGADVPLNQTDHHWCLHHHHLRHRCQVSEPLGWISGYTGMTTIKW